MSQRSAGGNDHVCLPKERDQERPWRFTARGSYTQAFAEEWVRRAEFRALYDAKTDAEYVDALFANAGAAPAADERAGLINGLASGAETRPTVFRKVAQNTFVVEAQFSPAFVYMQYVGYLRRKPNDSNLNGYNF